MKLYISIILHGIFLVTAAQRDPLLARFQDAKKINDRSIGASIESRFQYDFNDEMVLKHLKDRVHDIYDDKQLFNKRPTGKLGDKSNKAILDDILFNTAPKDIDLSGRKFNKEDIKDTTLNDQYMKQRANVDFNKETINPDLEHDWTMKNPFDNLPDVADIAKKLPARRRLWTRRDPSRRMLRRIISSTATTMSANPIASNKAKVPSLKKTPNINSARANIPYFKSIDNARAPDPPRIFRTKANRFVTSSATEKNNQKSFNMGKTDAIVAFDNIMRQQVPLQVKQKMLQEEMNRRKGSIARRYNSKNRKDTLNTSEDLLDDPILKNLNDLLLLA